MDFNELKSRPIADLRLLAAKYSIKTGPRSKVETIAKLIVEHITAPVKTSEQLKHVAELPKSPMVVHTEEQVRQAIAAYLAKDGYLATFPGDDTVIFRYKGAEESIHLSSALRVIKMKAETVSRGARKAITVKNMDGHDVMMAG